jgi:hypothetical protein
MGEVEVEVDKTTLGGEEVQVPAGSILLNSNL